MINIFRKITNVIMRRIDIYIRIPKAHKEFEKIQIMNSMVSIQYIIDHKCSVSRYGDGEIVMMFGGGYSGYQNANSLLAKRLKQIIRSYDAPNHVIGLPFPLKSSKGLRRGSKEFWNYFTLRRCKELLNVLPKDRFYVDTQLSRFYIIYNNKTNSSAQLQLLKKIWDNQDVVIIEGKQSRTGIGNNLYDNAKSIRRIIGYSTDAFSHYDDMIEAVKENVTTDKLILLSYGPTATVLAYDLAKFGYRAIDIGHLDIEYEWYLQGANDNIAIKGKFTNEAMGGRDVEDIVDNDYKNQIIADITNPW